MSNQSEETRVHPREPERMSAGRYTDALWKYEDRLGTLPEVALAYERDRANHYLGVLKHIELAYSTCKNEVAYKLAHTAVLASKEASK